MTASRRRPIPYVSDRPPERTDLPTILAAIQRRFGADARIVAHRKGVTVPQAIDRKKLTLLELGDFLGALVTRCIGIDRGFSETVITLQAEDAENLKQAAAVLSRMAPYAGAIRRVIAKGEKDEA